MKEFKQEVKGKIFEIVENMDFVKEEAKMNNYSENQQYKNFFEALALNDVLLNSI